MAYAVLAGPLGADARQTLTDVGTLALEPSPRPGTIGLDLPTGEDWTLPPGVPGSAAPSVVPVVTPVDGERGLTAGEVAMARLLFKDALDYHDVKVHNEEYLPFGLQPDDTAMTPNGEIWFNPKHFKEDFSHESHSDKHWFMHEMVHVWQHQLGYWVRLRGAIRIGLDYAYELKPGMTLGDYNMEAQGDLLADYFALKYLGAPRAMHQMQYADSLALFEEVLHAFIENPADTANLP